jgi:hypothetical protein
MKYCFSNHTTSFKVPENRIKNVLENITNLVRWKTLMNISLAPPAITSMPTDTLTEKLLHRRDKLLPRKWKSRKSDVCSLETATQRRGVVTLRQRDPLKLDAGSPEIGGFDGLRNAVRGDERIGPGGCSVAVEEGPVALWELSVIEFHILRSIR